MDLPTPSTVDLKDSALGLHSVAIPEAPAGKDMLRVTNTWPPTFPGTLRTFDVAMRNWPRNIFLQRAHFSFNQFLCFRCKLFHLLPDWGHCKVFQLTFVCLSLVVFASLVFKNLHIAFPVQSIILHLKRSWFFYQETLELSFAMIYFMLHVLIEVLRKQGPLVSCNSPDVQCKMSTNCACLSLKHSLWWFKSSQGNDWFLCSESYGLERWRTRESHPL